MIPLRSLLTALGASLILLFGAAPLRTHAHIAWAAPIEAQSTGGAGLSIPNPLDGIASMLSPDNLGKLVQDTGAFLLQRMVSGLHDLLIGLTQGNDNVITHTPRTMTYQQPGEVQKHDALLVIIDWGFAAALVVMGILVILGPNSPAVVPRVRRDCPTRCHRIHCRTLQFAVG